jgi:hypothetical protein
VTFAKRVVARFKREAVIRKEHGEYCVRSPNNPDWNGGCYPSKGQAEKRLHEVEYFKRQSYDRRVARELNLAEYGLEGLRTGQPVTLYHGTTRTFRTFDMGQTREDLVNQYYGRGIFLTPSKRVAGKYADANRNIGFPPSIIGDLGRRNPVAGKFMQSLYDHGPDGWEIFWKENGFWITDDPKFPEGRPDIPAFDAAIGGIDSNEIQDVADYVLGSSSKPLGGGDPVNIFNTSSGLPSYIYDTLDAIGLNSKIYRPKIYTCVVTVSNPLVTANKSQASKARQSGYDAVVFYGSDLVDGVPEVAVYNPRNVKVRHIEVL